MRRMITRRAALTALAGLTAMRGARAQAFPSHAISIVVPYPAGGPVDVTARLIAQSIGMSLGQPITIDNRGGGAGVIGSVAVARAQPDGHTLVLGTNQTHATNQSLLKNCPYDAVRDFAPVAGLATIPHVLVARRTLKIDSVAELVATTKAMPDKFYYGSTGVGSASHLAGELFKSRAGVDIRHVPFRGAAPLVTEMLAGRIDVSFATVPSVIAQIESGDLKPLAVASAGRSERLPQVPTLAELGIPGVEADAWFALFAPAKTPAAAIDALYQRVSAALANPAAREAVAKLGMTLALRPPAEVAAWLPGEVAKWAGVIKAAGVVVE
jgi:tripartite-type tricarboxylate transporter receptor subunit TctC